MPEILAELATVELHAIQTSGNCIRNITTDPFAGVAADETPIRARGAKSCASGRAFHPEFAYLPRKFKIAVNGAAEDRAVIHAHDIGLELVKNDAGELGFRVFVGGGLGRTPMHRRGNREFPAAGSTCSPIAKRSCASTTATVVATTSYKARIKILVKALGIDEFRARSKPNGRTSRMARATLTDDEVERVCRALRAPDYETTLADDRPPHCAARDRQGLRRLGQAQRARPQNPGLRGVTLSLKKTGVAPGDITDAQMDVVADLADRYSFGEVRVTHEQNLVLADVRAVRPVFAVEAAPRRTDWQRRTRPADRHDLLPRRRFLLARQRQVDSDRRRRAAPLRRSRLPARHRRDRAQHLRLHERLWPPPRRQHRHSRRR